MSSDYNPHNLSGKGAKPTDDVGWVNEPTFDDQKYDQKAFREMSRLSDTERMEIYKRILTHNPDRPVLEECLTHLKCLGEDTELVSIDPTTICYESNCVVCKVEIPAWTEGFLVTLGDGNIGYVCGDREECAARVLSVAFKKAVESDETPGGSDDSWIQNFTQ